jgi:hypothetical protein
MCTMIAGSPKGIPYPAVLLACLLLVAGGAMGYAQPSQDKTPVVPPQVYPCYRTSDTIHIDGVADEKAWEKAPLLQPFWRFQTTEEAFSGGNAQLLWDEDFLYLAATLKDQDLYAVLTKHDTTTWKDDVLEFFFKPLENAPQFYELHVTPKNTTLDIAYPKRDAGSWTQFAVFESNMVTAVQLRGTLNNVEDVDQGWSVEMKIPFAAIEVVGGKTPAPGDQWRFALCRYNYSVHLPDSFAGGPENSATIRNLQNGFNNYEQYDFLHFLEVQK